MMTSPSTCSPASIDLKSIAMDANERGWGISRSVMTSAEETGGRGGGGGGGGEGGGGGGESQIKTPSARLETASTPPERKRIQLDRGLMEKRIRIGWPLIRPSVFVTLGFITPCNPPCLLPSTPQNRVIVSPILIIIYMQISIAPSPLHSSSVRFPFPPHFRPISSNPSPPLPIKNHSSQKNLRKESPKRIPKRISARISSQI